MIRLQALLFLSFLCTCALAQKTDLPKMGSGSLVVNFEPNAWTVTITSATYKAYHKFVNESQFKAFPSDYEGFTIISDQDRYNMGMVHHLIDELEDKGWQFLHSNHTVGVNGYANEVLEKMYFSFRAPRSKPILVSQDSLEMVFPAAVVKNDVVRMRGGILKTGDGKFYLRVEEFLGDRWLQKYKLTETGLLTADMVSRIKSINLTGNRIVFLIELATGLYSYSFMYMGADYRLVKMVYRNRAKCGLKAYELRLTKHTTNEPIGFYRPEPCDAEKAPRPFYSTETLGLIVLKDFMPGSRSLELKRPGTKFYY